MGPPPNHSGKNAWKVKEGSMRKLMLIGVVMMVGLSLLQAQTTKNAKHLVPTGKGWGC